MSILTLLPPPPEDDPSEVERNLRLMKAAPDLAFLLLDVLDELHDLIDVEDGSDGNPRPNWAMRLNTRIANGLREAGVKLP